MPLSSHSIALPRPAAGANLVYTVQGAGPEVLLAVRAQLLTSAVVANRLLLARVLDAGGLVLAEAALPTGNIAAGTTVRGSWGRGFTRGSDVLPSGPTVAENGLPELLLPEGCTVVVVVDNADAGDQLSLGAVTVLRESDEDAD